MPLLLKHLPQPDGLGRQVPAFAIDECHEDQSHARGVEDERQVRTAPHASPATQQCVGVTFQGQVRAAQ